MQKFNWIVAGIMVFWVGCGGSGSSIPLSDLPPKLAESLCTAYQNCFGPAFSFFLNGSDCVAVTEQRIRNGSFPLLQGKVDQGKLRYDGSKAQACLDSFNSRTCAQMLDRNTAQCLAALDGTVEIGGNCDLDEECKGEALCKSSTGTCPGQCTPLLVAGQACTKDDNCQSGLQCSSETKLCVVPAAIDQACEFGAPPCGPGLLCLGKDDDKQTPGTCKSAAQALAGLENGPCDPTIGQLCQSSLSCVLDNATLIPPALTWKCIKVSSYAASDACKIGYPDACTSGNYCKTGDGLLALAGGTCQPIPAAGEACGTGLSQCQVNAVCVSGTCQNLTQNGVSCSGDAMCYSEKCGSSGGCEANLPCK
jgi:hypothetical protein